MKFFSITLALAAVALPAQESLQLKDGRFVVDKKMSVDDKGVTIHFENGEILVPKDMVKSTTARKEGKERKWTAAEQKKIDAGLVLHNGKWTKKRTVEQERARTLARRKAKIDEARKHRKWKDHYELSTAHFQFKFTIDPEVMAEYAEMMEAYYKAITKEFKIRGGKAKGPVCIYHDEAYYYQVSGAPNGAIGYFRFVDPIELNFFYSRLDEEMTQDVMFHELNHYLTYLIEPRFFYPIWINESLAEYYGASDWDAKRKKVSINGMQEGRLATIQDATGLNKKIDRQKTASSDLEGNWMKLEDLIRTPHASFSPTHYAWGWSFAHFLLENSRYAAKFKKYFVDLARSKSIKKVLYRGTMQTVEAEEQIKWLLKYLKVKDLETLQEEWYKHIRSLKAVSARGYRRAGDIALIHDKPIKATRLFKTALDMGSESPLAYFGLGKAHYRRSQYDEALAAFRKCTELDPLNGMFYVWQARALGGSVQDRQRPEVKRLKRLALEIEPENYEIILTVAWDDIFVNDDDSGK